MSSGDIVVDNCKFISNTATSTESMGYASALLCTDYNDVIGDTYINNCLFTDNYNIGGKSTIFAKSLANSTVHFTNNTVVDNHSNYGIEFIGDIDCTNNIIRNTSNYEIALLDQTNQGIISEIDIAYNNIDGGQSAIYNQNNVNIVNWLEGNIDVDPLFLLSGDDPYQLTELSPCIDAGTTDTTGLYLPPWDLLDNQRIWDGDGNGEAVIDMGCYEYGAALASGFIAGTVTNQNGAVLGNAEIAAGNYSTTTDENGAYQVEVIVGNYSVSCYLEDYAIPDEIEVTVNLGETSYANFILVPGVNADDPLPEAGIRFTNYPNPFNPETTIHFNVTQNSAFATLEIFNIKGQKVKTLMECQVSTGDFNCIWKGRDDNGKRVSSGTYIARLKIDGKEQATRKIMLLK
ncbi:MAG TPA: FlgD immunoglobulin-like domain containing protein [Candidatus Cloacimonadota bacterium]|nr:FlgD immunoglobulin-like domain containing protein [Candidatus Cloacimonadota bacterium]